MAAIFALKGVCDPVDTMSGWSEFQSLMVYGKNENFL